MSDVRTGSNAPAGAIVDDLDDPRLAGDARKVVASGRYLAIEDGNGGLYLRHANDIPGLNYPSNRIMAQPVLARIEVKKEKGNA